MPSVILKAFNNLQLSKEKSFSYSFSVTGKSCKMSTIQKE